MYTDKQRQQIAKEQYENYNFDSVGEEVTIGKGKDDIHIGYISEVTSTMSGLQAYVITDVELPEHPTSEDYAKVKQVTVLYKGSTGLNELPTHPIDVTGDWLFNNVPMTKHIVSPDWLPFQGPTPQLENAADFANDMMGRYSNAYFDFYGHSLGSMNTQYSVVSLDENYHNRVSGVYVYNGPNIYKILDKSQRQNAAALHDRIYNYVDPLDIVGLGYEQKEGAVGQVFVVDNPKSKEGFVDQHVFGGYTYDDYGNMIDKRGRLVHANALLPVDIDGDGKKDTKIKELTKGFRNYFDETTSNRYGQLVQSDPITINAPTLRRLARNIQSSVLADLKTIRTITEKCQAKNASIQTSFEERKTQVSEQIKDVLAKNALMSVFDGLDQSLNQLVKQVGLFETLAKPGQMSYPFSASETPYDGNRVLSLDRYEINLSILSTKASSLASSCQEETVGLFDGIFKRPSLLKSWKIIDEASRQLIKESDRVFEGTGLREGKADGISQSLNDVFEVQLPDIAELERLVLNTVELISGVANHFTTVDTWLGDNLKQGRFQGSAGPVSLPPSYQAYLERTGILDDVTGVLQAFDKQVEERCKAYAQKVGETYNSVLSTLSAGLDRWQSETKALVNSTEAIEVTFSNPIDVETTRLVDKKTVTTRSYWGTLGSLYPSKTKSAVQSATTVLPPIVNRFDEVVNQVSTARYRLQQMGQELRLIIEKGVYTAFDLDEIVSSQKIAAGLLQKMIVELQFVKTAIDSSMSGKAAKALVTHLGLLVQRLGYYEQLVSDCFGTQGSAIQSATGGQSSASKSFSLN